MSIVTQGPDSDGATARPYPRIDRTRYGDWSRSEPVGPPARPRVGDGEHVCRMRPLGYVRRSRETRMDCERPMRFVCRTPSCGKVQHYRCRCSDELKCRDCSERARKLLVRLIIEGALLRDSGYWYMVTLTAPGDPGHQRYIPYKRGRHGECGCGDHGLSAGQWNRQESRWWNRLRTSLAREFGDLAYVSSVEVQSKRADAMLHRHALVWSPVPIPVGRAHELALRAGYGCSMQWQKPYSAASVANYVAKYITKSSGQRSEVPWEYEVVVPDTGEVLSVSRPATYRTWSKANRWGVTIQGLRSIMAAQARARARYLEELGQAIAEEAGSLAPVSAGHVHMAGAAPP